MSLHCIKEIEFSNFKWIDINNPNLTDLKEISQQLHINKILLIDSLQEGHLPKFERLDSGYFMILRSFTSNQYQKFSVNSFSNKIAFFVFDNRLITIHRKDFSFLHTIPKNIESKNQLLLYIINQMIDSYEKPMNEQQDEIDAFEEIVFTKNGNSISLENLYYEKSKARIVKKLLLLSQQTINHIEVEKELKIELEDIKDSLTSYLLLYDEILEDASALLNSYLSITAQKNNDVMKLLTIFSAFFLPLTFIVGVYGMNFEHMPELKMYYGYYAVMAFMAIVSLVVFFWFKRKKIF